VTEQLETAAALTESEKRFLTYAETLSHVFFSCDPEGKVTQCKAWRESRHTIHDLRPRFLTLSPQQPEGASAQDESNAEISTWKLML